MDALWVRVTLGVLVFMTIALTQVQAIRCWECKSKLDGKCGDPFLPGNFLPTDCSMRDHYMNLTATVCRKITQKVKGEVRVLRSCGYIKDERSRTCYRRAGTFDIQVEYCECEGDQDGCNTATTTFLALSSNLLYLIPVLGFGMTTQLWL